jgi:hypothetical protein
MNDTSCETNIKECILRKSIKTSTGCLEWPGPFAKKDHAPIIKIAGVQKNPRTVLFKLQFPNIVAKKVFNVCGNPKCIAPEHSSAKSRTRTLEEKLARKVITSNGCHVFPNQKRKDRYAKISHDGKSLSAHRLAYFLAKGEIPENKEIHHSCNNKSCFNPEHLSSETPEDNKRFAKRDGLLCGPKTKGEMHRASKLAIPEIALIRQMAADGLRPSQIAKRYGTSTGHIRHIIRGLKHKGIRIAAHRYLTPRYGSLLQTLSMVAENLAGREKIIAVATDSGVRYFYNQHIEHRWLEFDLSQTYFWQKDLREAGA